MSNNLNSYVKKTATKWKLRAKSDRENREKIRSQQIRTLKKL